MEKLINALLNDEDGISEASYVALLDYLELEYSPKDEGERLGNLVRSADATDGRFYFPLD